jgi:hypothetical protein
MKRTLIFALLMTMLLSACGSFAPAQDELRGFAGAPAVEYYAGSDSYYEMPAAEPMPGIVIENAKLAWSNTAPQAQERMVIQNADLSITVKDPQVKMDAINAMAQRMGGFVVSSSLYSTYKPSGVQMPEGSIVIRVPSEKLDAALEEIKEGVVSVDSENRSGQDVTQEYTDLKSRLRNLESAERQLDAIMKDAKTTEEVLAVYNQLTSVRGEIELIKGQMQYFEQAAALSAISVRIVAEDVIAPIEIGGWKPEGVLNEAVQTLVRFWQGLVDFLIWAAVFILPAALTVLLPLAGLWALARKLFKKKQA